LRPTWHPMSRRATLTTVLTAMLLVAVPYTVLATDSDGDGTDDADDDFPNNPCADTDTDGDGLPDTVVSGCSSQSVVGYTSFEEPDNGTKYYDYGDETTNHYLWNNVNESHVAYNTTGNELGFTLYYESTGGVGLTDGDYFGVVTYTGTVGNFTDGTKGYQMSDVDGIATLALDDITAETLTFDLFVQDDGWEWSSSSYDYINISFVGANSDISILSTYGTDIDTGYASYLDTWTTMTVAIGAAGNGHLEVEFSSNSGTEAIYIDDIRFTSTVVLTADLDDDGDGWSDADESDCGTDSSDGNSTPSDSDSDGVCDVMDDDTDNDGWSDAIESDCGSDQMDPDSVPADQDGDSQCDATDADIDGDGYDNDDDAFPSDAAEWVDSDGDGIGDNADSDDDGDGWGDSDDEFPDDASEWVDSDGDGTGDNADSDDDGDGWSDATESDCGSDSLDEDSVPADFDSDGQCDDLDPDDDGDGVADSDDAKPMDPSEWDDTDGDGIGDNSDLDDDNDGWSDAEEDECGTDQYDSDSTPVDYDSNGVCDANDPIVEPEPDGTPGFGLLSALTVLALAAFARRD